MPRGLNESHMLITNMNLFVNISNFFKWICIYIMTFSVAYWDTWDDGFALYYARGRHSWHAPHNNSEQTHAKDTSKRTWTPSVITWHYDEVVDH